VALGSGNTNAFNLSVNGNREYGNSIRIDGVESTTNRTQDVTVQPSVDAVQEFKVSTSAYNAEFGSSAEGVVSIETKAGTNALHGDAFEFFRPNFTTAKPYGFGGLKEPASILKQHNYGGTLAVQSSAIKPSFLAPMRVRDKIRHTRILIPLHPSTRCHSWRTVRRTFPG
jgi:hypothetical protein